MYETCILHAYLINEAINSIFARVAQKNITFWYIFYDKKYKTVP